MMRLGPWLLGVALAATQANSDDVFDLVIRGGRVVDPESATDAVRDVAVKGGRIVRVSESPLAGRRVLDAKGLVVAPGFIDLHQHGQNPENDRLKV
jgi:N-acyl-D-glutamate deacylase